MAVTKQAYTVTAPWTNSQLANIFRDAFIDAGLMTSWFDSFTSTYTPSGGTAETIQHRVLKIEAVQGKRFGVHYHWFVFRANGSTDYVMCHTWNNVTHKPTGNVHVDYYRDTYNPQRDYNGSSHMYFGSHVTSTTTTLTRYSSSLRPGFSYFLLKGGTNFFCWTFQPSGSIPQPYIDVSKFSTAGLIVPQLQRSNDSDPVTSGRYSPTVSFMHVLPLYRNIHTYGRTGRVWGNNSSDSNPFGSTNTVEGNTASPGVVYQAFFVVPENNVGDLGSNWGYNSITQPCDYNAWDGSRVNRDQGIRNHRNSSGMYIPLPATKQASNPLLTSDQTPVFLDLPYSLYYTDRMPIDFGICWHFSNSTMEVQDVFQVTPGVEEWEILAVENFGGGANGSPMLLARIV